MSPRTMRLIAIKALVFAAASPAYASGSGMPWEVPLLAVADSITGPVAQGAAVVAVILRARPYLL